MKKRSFWAVLVLGLFLLAAFPAYAAEQNHSLLFNQDGSYTARAGKIIAGTPMGRFGNPEELIGAALFLASDEASGFVNGIVLPVDGGYSAYSGV